MGSPEVFFQVPPFSIPFSRKRLSDTLVLNQFQAEVQRLLDGGKDVLLTAPTGGGKTLTLLLNTETSQKGISGFTALYPNNTLLKNQMCTVEDIIVEHLGASLVDIVQGSDNSVCKDGRGARRCECTGASREENRVAPLSIYKIDRERVDDSWVDYDYVGFLLLSGRYIQSEEGVPRREVLYRLAEDALKYANSGGLYLIVFATPDTFLLVMTGAYRDFEGVGKTLHNLLVALARGSSAGALEKVLRETGVLARTSVSETVAAAERILDLPLFVDEFHLYGSYELDALHALLRLYKERFDRPVVLSSATPADDIVGELVEQGSLPGYEEVRAELVEGGRGFQVRGSTEFVLVPVDTKRKGLPSYFSASEAVADIAVSSLDSELRGLSGGRALIILERLWMVSEVARGLARKGFDVDCIATITPRDVCRPGASIIVGSEATTQGVNLGRVVLGVIGGTSSEDVIQRVGRIGRRGTDSRVYLVLPRLALDDNPPPSKSMSYYEMVDWIREAYPDYPKRKREVSRLIPRGFHDARRMLIYSLGVASLARVSGMHHLLRRINIGKTQAAELLESIVGPASSLVKLLVFRRTGFNVRYLIQDTGEDGETSIGLLTRNFEVKDTRNGTLIVALNPARQSLRLSLAQTPWQLRGKMIELSRLLELTGGRIEIGERVTIKSLQKGDTLVYVLDAGDELADYLSYTGEGADILTPGGRRYAVVFV